MLKDNKHIIGYTLFGIAIYTFFSVDFVQTYLQHGSTIRKAIVFTSGDVVQILLLLSISIIVKSRIIEFAAFSWVGYDVEMIYDRFVNEGDSEFYSWLIPVSFVSIYLVYHLYKYLKNDPKL